VLSLPEPYVSSLRLSVVDVTQSLVLCVVFCISLLLLLSSFVWLLYCTWMRTASDCDYYKQNIVGNSERQVYVTFVLFNKIRRDDWWITRRYSIFSFMCSVLYIIASPFVLFRLAIVLYVLQFMGNYLQTLLTIFA
jgi:hypothetical protein